MAEESEGIIVPLLEALWGLIAGVLNAVTPTALVGLGIILAGICIFF